MTPRWRDGLRSAKLSDEVSGEKAMTEPALTARGPAHHGAFVEVARGLVLAAMLAALAGMVDAIGYLHLKGLFVSFMSGNSTQLAVSLGQGNLAEAGTISKLV